MLADKLRAATGGADPAAWDLANAVYQGSPVNFFYFTESTLGLPTDVFFKDDGLKMYAVFTSTVSVVREYNLSTAWDIATATYLQEFNIVAQDTSATGIFFKPDGLKMYVLGNSGDDVNEYNLSTAWDITTASFLQLFSVAAQELTPSGIFFKPDGLKMYIVGTTGDDVNEYNLSTAWDITTASFLQLFSVAGQETSPVGLFFKPDGLKMYVVGSTGDAVYEYNLSTAWDISTASFLQNRSVTDVGTTPQGVFFKTDGTRMFIVDLNRQVFQYTLSTAWDISTATYALPSSDYLSIADQEATPEDIFFKPDGLKMYFVGSNGDDVNEYNLSTAWDISTASYLQTFSVAAQDVNPRGLFFKPDGLKMYVVGLIGDNVNEYDLSTAWDISTASFLQLFSVAAQETSPTGLFFRSDGLKMYVVGTAGIDINEYDLSTAWDVSTASYLQNFSFAVQFNGPSGVFFKPNGLRMYVTGGISLVNEYILSTPWDISTASYLQNLSVLNLIRGVSGVTFRPNGLKMYVIGTSSPSIWSYNFV